MDSVRDQKGFEEPLAVREEPGSEYVIAPRTAPLAWKKAKDQGTGLGVGRTEHTNDHLPEANSIISLRCAQAEEKRVDDG